MTVKNVVVRKQAGMHLVATTGSGFTVHFDSGEDRTAPGPTEVVLAALASCSAMDVISILAKKRQAYDRYEIHVRGDQRSGYPQVFTRIDVVHELEGPVLDVAAVRRSIELSATKYCPVIAMLAAGATEIHNAYRVVRTGALPLDESGEVVVVGPYRRPEILRAAAGQE
jgi:putative redox protein